MADDPNNELLPQILAILGAEKASDETSASISSEHKGIIKDSKPKELPASLTSTEEGRVRNIGKVLAVAIGQELQIGKYAPGPEAGRLKMAQTKVGSAVGDKGKSPPPTSSSSSSLSDLASLAWPALLAGVAAAAAALYDDLGALGRGLSKIALKLAPFLGTLAKLSGKIFRGIGRVVDALGNVFKYFSTKGIAGFIDDLKARFPKTTKFVDDTIKYFDDFKNWLKKTWIGNVVRSMKGVVRRLIDTIKIGAWSKLMDPVIDGADVNKKLTRLQKVIKSIKGWFFSGINRILNPSAMKAMDDLKAAAKSVGAGVDKAKELGKFGKALKTTMSAVKTVGSWIGKAGGWIASGFSAITEIGGTVLKLFGGGGGTLGKMLKGAMKFVGKMLQPLLKKLPLIGAVMSIGFAFARFNKGEIIPAILELISGILTFIPGIGTVGSILIDGALMLYDMDKQKQEDAAKGIKPGEGGFMSKIGKWVSDYILPILRYLPVIGSIFYFADSIKAFTSSDMFNGIDNLLKGLIAIVGGKGLVDIVNTAYPIIASFFNDSEKSTEAETVGGKKEGGFFSNLVGKIADFIIPKLRYLPVIGAFFYGKDAWDAFSSGSWGKGFLYLGQALISLIGGPLGSVINMGIDFITSIFDSEPTQEQEIKTQGGGFTAVIKGAFDALVGIVSSAIDSMISWVKDTFADMTMGAAKGVNAAMAKIPGGKYITAAGEWIAEKVIPEPADLPGGLPQEQLALRKRYADAAAKHGYTDYHQAVKAAGFSSASQWAEAGFPGPKQQPTTLMQAAAPVAALSSVAAPKQQPTPVAQAAAPAASNRTENTTPTTDPEELTKRAKAKGWSTKEQYKAWNWRSREEVMVEVKDRGWNTIEEYKAANFKTNPKKTAPVAQAATPAASAPGTAPKQQPAPVAQTAAPAATAPPKVAAPVARDTTTATGAATSGIMSALGISQQPVSMPSTIQQASGPVGASSNTEIPSDAGGTQARNFKGGQGEAYALARSLAARAGSPDPDLTASLVMLESGWLKSSMVRRANNPSGQTITRGQIGKEGIIGGTIGRDGQLHAVYTNLEAAFAHHVRRWKSRYVAGNVLASTKNLVSGGYNTENPAWSKMVQDTYSRWSGRALAATPQYTLSGSPPTAAMAPGPSTLAAAAMPSAAMPSMASPQISAGMSEPMSMPSAAGSLAEAAAPSAATPSPIPGGFDQYFNSPSFGAALSARGNVGASQVGGSWKSASGTTLCAAGAMVVAGIYTKSDAIKKARIGSATNLARNPNNPLTSTGIYKDLGGLPSGYVPVDGDLVAMAGGSKGFGHALVYIGGKWYAHKSGDNTPQQYLSSGKYNSPRLYRLSQAAAASVGQPDAISASGFSTPSIATGALDGAVSVGSAPKPTSGIGGLFNSISNFFTGGKTTAQPSADGLYRGLQLDGAPMAQSSGGGIANLSSSSTPSPMPTAGAESNITSKMDDIATRHISKADEEIGILKGIDTSIKELAKQISNLSRVTVNNVAGGSTKTNVTTANIPDTDARLNPQTSSGFMGGKMFGYG